MGMRIEMTPKGADVHLAWDIQDLGHLLFLMALSEIFKAIIIKLWYSQLNLGHLEQFERVAPGCFPSWGRFQGLFWKTKLLTLLPSPYLSGSKLFPFQILRLFFSLHCHKIGVSHSRSCSFTFFSPIHPWPCTKIFSPEGSSTRGKSHFYTSYRVPLDPPTLHCIGDKSIHLSDHDLGPCDSNKRIQVAEPESRLKRLFPLLAGLPPRRYTSQTGLGLS